jgi:transcriptional regulator with XRE-family HTH domain
MSKLSELLSERLDLLGMSVRKAADKIGVSHATVARAANGETVEVDTFVKIADFLGVPLNSLLDDVETPDEVYEQISVVFTIEPELKNVLTRIAKKIEAKTIDPKILSELAGFASYRLHEQEIANKVAEEKKAAE